MPLLGLVTSATVTVAQIPNQPFEAGKGNLRLGPVRIHPFLSVGEMYDSNVFLQPTDTQYDFITVISPGFILNLPAGRHQLTVGYRNDILEYARFPQESNVRYTGQLRVCEEIGCEAGV